MFLATKLDGFIALLRGGARHGFPRSRRRRITAPTLVIVGAKDPATLPE